MTDLTAGVTVLRGLLAAAPRIEGGDGTELAFDLRSAVEQIVRAVEPGAAVPPRYEGVYVAQNTLYPIGRSDLIGIPIDLSVHENCGLVVATITATWRGGDVTLTGATHPDNARLAGLGLLSVAAEATRVRGAK
jgi:hypothetical protein